MSWNGRYVNIYRRYIAVDLEWRKHHDRLFIKMILHSYLMIGEINILWLIANERKTIILKNNTKSYVVVVLASICDLNRSIERGWWGGRGGNKEGGRKIVGGGGWRAGDSNNIPLFLFGPTTLSCFRRHLCGLVWASLLTPTPTDVFENMTGWWGQSITPTNIFLLSHLGHG